MKTNTTLLAAALAAAAVLPGIASASYILDTGTPAGSGALILSSSQWVAGELSLTQGQSITDVAAYLTQGAGQPGDTFTWELYAAGTGFTARSSSREQPTFTASGSFSQNGWNDTTVANWVVPTTGNYWLALQVNTGNHTAGLDLPTEVVGQTGTAAALGWAIAPSSHQYAIAGATQAGVGLRANVAETPIPAAAWLLLSGFAALTPWGRRMRPSSFHS